MSSSSHVYWKSPEPEADLHAALEMVKTKIIELTSQVWDSKTATIGGIRDHKLCSLASIPAGWSSLLLHSNSVLAEPLALQLSKVTTGLALAFYDYDQDAWGFSAYQNGSRIARFGNRPEVAEEDPQECTVNPKVIADLFGVSIQSIAPYLQHLGSDEEDPGKAFPEDEFSLGNHWVMCDSMRRLGLRYAEPTIPGARYVFIEERPNNRLVN